MEYRRAFFCTIYMGGDLLWIKRTAFANRICNEKAICKWNLVRFASLSPDRIRSWKPFGYMEAHKVRRSGNLRWSDKITTMGFRWNRCLPATGNSRFIFCLHWVTDLTIICFTHTKPHSSEYRKLLPRHAESIYFDRYVEGIHFIFWIVSGKQNV